MFYFAYAIVYTMEYTEPGDGFTIIETLIVLALAGIILLILFLSIPALNRTHRNYNRKNAVNYVAGELDSYYDIFGTYPLSGTGPANDKRTSFVNGLKNGGPTKFYDLRYTDNHSSHEYPYDTGAPEDALDEISIEPGHKCNRSSGVGPGDTDYPLEAANGGDADFKAYVIWTQLENAPIYCVDNSFNN